MGLIMKKIKNEDTIQQACPTTSTNILKNHIKLVSTYVREDVMRPA